MQPIRQHQVAQPHKFTRARLVECAQNVRNISYMWDQMWRASIHYGRKGLGVHAISAVDIALWDLLGKVKNEPVYNLLGGKTKERVPCYATTSRPDLAKDLGFFGAKVPLPWGPHAGDVGMRKNIEFIAEWRQKLGPDFPLVSPTYARSNTSPLLFSLVAPPYPASRAVSVSQSCSLPLCASHARWPCCRVVDGRLLHGPRRAVHCRALFAARAVWREGAR